MSPNTNAMTNQEALSRLNASHGATVTELYWIAVSGESWELEETVNNLTMKEWASIFPLVSEAEIYQHAADDTLLYLLTNAGYLGFIASVFLPGNLGFKFNDDGAFESCSESLHSKHAHVLYAETLDELIDRIERIAQQCFDADMEEARKQQGIPAPA